jgi:hypothetical protein
LPLVILCANRFFWQGGELFQWLTYKYPDAWNVDKILSLVQADALRSGNACAKCRIAKQVAQRLGAMLRSFAGSAHTI